jgi:hypothetical protein
MVLLFMVAAKVRRPAWAKEKGDGKDLKPNDFTQEETDIFTFRFTIDLPFFNGSIILARSPGVTPGYADLESASIFPINPPSSLNTVRCCTQKRLPVGRKAVQHTGVSVVRARSLQAINHVEINHSRQKPAFPGFPLPFTLPEPLLT